MPATRKRHFPSAKHKYRQHSKNWRVELRRSKGHTVPRLLFFLASPLMIAGAALALQSCGSEKVEAAPSKGPTNSLVTLPDGSTIVAAKGTLTRGIGEWLQSRKGDSAQFQFAGFHETKPRLTSAGIGRAADLATILRASPATKVEFAGDEAQAESLSRFLIDRGIGEERLKVVPAAGLGTVTLTIYRTAGVGDDLGSDAAVRTS